jgi:hypothetical protein
VGARRLGSGSRLGRSRLGAHGAPSADRCWGARWPVGRGFWHGVAAERLDAVQGAVRARAGLGRGGLGQRRAVGLLLGLAWSAWENPGSARVTERSEGREGERVGEREKGRGGGGWEVGTRSATRV